MEPISPASAVRDSSHGGGQGTFTLLGYEGVTGYPAPGRARLPPPPHSRERPSRPYDSSSTCSRCPLPLTGTLATTLPFAS
jgi:hypothetical protein